MVLRFSSGSVLPAKAERKRVEASTPFTFNPIPSYCFKTLSNSFLRKSPLFTNIQCNCFPIALLSNTAATVESTPPDKPKITFSLPICVFSCVTVISTKLSDVQLGVSLAILKRKLANSFIPSAECVTSG